MLPTKRSQHDETANERQALLLGTTSRLEGQSQRRKSNCTNKCTSLRVIALTLFVLVSLYWAYKIYINVRDGGWNVESSSTSRPYKQQQEHIGELKLVSVLNRHGDRAPSDSLPEGDNIALLGTNFFWPRGLGNLTDVGRFRQFRLGLELRKRYERYLDYNASSYLALSSPMTRCHESLERTLAGLFDIDWTLARGLELVDQYNAPAAATQSCVASSATCDQSLSLPGGSGSPQEYKRIVIDTSIMPMLEYRYLNKCKYRLKNPTPVDVNLRASEAVRQLKGLQELEAILASKYQQQLNFTALGLWSTIAGEVRLARTRNSIAYGAHYFDWVNKRVPEYQSAQQNITLFDLYEQVAVLAYRDRIETGTASRIQLGPILTSLIASQEVALGRVPAEAPSVFGGYESHHLYRNKKVVLYSSHDSILQLLMHRLNIIRANATRFQEQFNRWHASSDVDQLLAGFRMCQFGMSLVFELYELEAPLSQSDEQTAAAEPPPRLAYLQAALYNEADPKYKPVVYKRLDFGLICRQLFAEQNPTSSESTIESFYQREKGFRLDEKKSCPFELFKNITANYVISSQELNKLCG